MNLDEAATAIQSQSRWFRMIEQKISAVRDKIKRVENTADDSIVDVSKTPGFAQFTVTAHFYFEEWPDSNVLSVIQWDDWDTAKLVNRGAVAVQELEHGPGWAVRLKTTYKKE
jgi:hypothetical protein